MPAAPSLPPRWRLAERRESESFTLDISYGDYEAHYEIGVSPPEGQIGEFFVCAGVKQGSPHFWDLHAGAYMLSLLLQLGVPIEEIRACIGGSVFAHAIDKAHALRQQRLVPVAAEGSWRAEDGTCRECSAGEGEVHRVTCGAHRDQPTGKPR